MIAAAAVAPSLFVVAEHIAFLVLQIFFWQKPLGMKLFRRTPEEARSCAGLAANQGLYNGFLAAGLALGLGLGEMRFTSFFLGCVVVAGLFGAATVNKRIFFVQAVPAVVASVALALRT